MGDCVVDGIRDGIADREAVGLSDVVDVEVFVGDGFEEEVCV